MNKTYDNIKRVKVIIQIDYMIKRTTISLDPLLFELLLKVIDVPAKEWLSARATEHANNQQVAITTAGISRLVQADIIKLIAKPELI